MKRIIVTPAGRKRYLEILFTVLKNNKNEFDRWDIWVNTSNQEDIDYIYKISTENDFIETKKCKLDYTGGPAIHSFFTDYINDDELYLRIDDDVVYIQKGSINKMFEEREKDKEHFLLYGNIVNNAIITHLHQRNGCIKLDKGRVGYESGDSLGWRDEKYAEYIHKTFITKLNEDKIDDFKINDWILFDFERVSINVISWRGDEFNKFDGIVGGDEEQWLSVDKPREINKYNKIIGDSIFVHYAFFTQRDHLDTTPILQEYKKII